MATREKALIEILQPFSLDNRETITNGSLAHSENLNRLGILPRRLVFPANGPRRVSGNATGLPMSGRSARARHRWRPIRERWVKKEDHAQNERGPRKINAKREIPRAVFS
ncbi:hypothetical protein LJR255_003860 [Pararhizobium sp. LjRoot255]|uniref:hypothetical protein n=1 Tax=Pararhizobium sp. LjRoot255 TaxID=3342298 RepID=UPI003ECEB37E